VTVVAELAAIQTARAETAAALADAVQALAAARAAVKSSVAAALADAEQAMATPIPSKHTFTTKPRLTGTSDVFYIHDYRDFSSTPTTIPTSHPHVALRFGRALSGVDFMEFYNSSSRTVAAKIILEGHTADINGKFVTLYIRTKHKLAGTRKFKLQGRMAPFVFDPDTMRHSQRQGFLIHSAGDNTKYGFVDLQVDEEDADGIYNSILLNLGTGGYIKRDLHKGYLLTVYVDAYRVADQYVSG
jgi:hypothetical protein